MPVVLQESCIQGADTRSQESQLVKVSGIFQKEV